MQTGNPKNQQPPQLLMPQQPQRPQRRSASFRGCPPAGGRRPLITASHQQEHQRPESPITIDPSKLAPKRSSFSDAASLSPTRRRKFATPAPGESEVFDRRLEDSLRDLRIMQTRQLARQAGSSICATSTTVAIAIPEEPRAAADCLGAGEAGGGGIGLRKRAQSLAATMFNLQDLQQAAANSSSSSNAMSATGQSPPNSTGAANKVTFPNEFKRERRRASMQDAIDASKINADLYSKLYNQTSTTIQSIQEENFGQLNFSLEFREETGILTVRVIQAIDLQAKDSATGLANPYCRVALLPNRKTQTTTKIHKKTLTPEFEEEFIFELKPQDINWSVLEITLFDYDPCSMDECLGQVKLPLVEVDFSEKQVMWKGICSLEKNTDPEHSVGDLQFSLSYLPSAKRLSVSIMKARNLREAHKDKPLADSSVRVTLSTQNGKKQKKKKTSSCKTPGNPVWEEALVFNGVPEEDLTRGSLDLIVCHDGVLSSSEISRVYLGPDTGGDEYQHWWNMVKSKSAAARWHKLYPMSHAHK